MPRPTTKASLLAASQANYQRLMDFIGSLPEAERAATFHGASMNRNIRDVLAHLHQWHLMMLGWYQVGMAREKPVMPAEGYTWKTVPELNRKIWEQSQQTELSSITSALQHSYQQLQELIARHTDTELFEKKHYPWTGSTSLGAYLISATSSHYDWAWKLIRRGRKS